MEPKKKKSRKKLFLTLLLMGIALIAGLGFFALSGGLDKILHPTQKLYYQFLSGPEYGDYRLTVVADGSGKIETVQLVVIDDLSQTRGSSGIRFKEELDQLHLSGMKAEEVTSSGFRRVEVTLDMAKVNMKEVDEKLTDIVLKELVDTAWKSQTLAQFEQDKKKTYYFLEAEFQKVPNGKFKNLPGYTEE
ncbi:hypothetical protein STRDD13_01041 [Streptococcus sp. DD13]|nr:hypothetical protein STRDD13_01041 [Streptococcus sp. DD13]